MSEGERRTSFESRTVGPLGRSIGRAREQYLIADEPAYAGGQGESWSPEELFLGGISSCAAGLLELVADNREITLEQSDVTVEGVRLEETSNEYERVEIHVQLRGPNQDEGEELIDAFQYH